MAEESARRFSEHLAENVRSWRAARQLSQSRLAALMAQVGCRWSHSTVSAIENGDRAVNIDELFGLAAVMNVTPADLLDPKGHATGNFKYWGKPLDPTLAKAWARSLVRCYLNTVGEVTFTFPPASELRVVQLLLQDFLGKQGEQQ